MLNVNANNKMHHINMHSCLGKQNKIVLSTFKRRNTIFSKSFVTDDSILAQIHLSLAYLIQYLDYRDCSGWCQMSTAVNTFTKLLVFLLGVLC